MSPQLDQFWFAVSKAACELKGCMCHDAPAVFKNSWKCSVWFLLLEHNGQAGTESFHCGPADRMSQRCVTVAVCKHALMWLILPHLRTYSINQDQAHLHQDAMASVWQELFAREQACLVQVSEGCSYRVAAATRHAITEQQRAKCFSQLLQGPLTTCEQLVNLGELMLQVNTCC